MNRIVRGALCALAMLAAGSVCAKEVIKVGAILPLGSAGVGAVAQGARDALLLRASEISADSRFDYYLLVEDDAYSPRQSIMAARKLVDADNVDVLMTLWGNGTNNVLSVLQGSDVVHVSPTRWMSPPDYNLDFVLSGSAQEYAQKAVDLLSSLGVARVAVVMSKDAAHDYCMTFLRPMLAAKGIEIVDEYFPNPTVRDFRGWIAQLKQKAPEAVVHNVFPPAAEIILRQMHELDFSAIQVGLGNFFTEVDPDYVKGACYVLQQPDAPEFVAAYEAKFGATPRYPAANYYDALSVLVDVCEGLGEGQAPTAQAIAEGLRSIENFEGAMGKTRFVQPNKLECELSYFLHDGVSAQEVSLDTLTKFYKQ